MSRGIIYVNTFDNVCVFVHKTYISHDLRGDLGAQEEPEFGKG